MLLSQLQSSRWRSQLNLKKLSPNIAGRFSFVLDDYQAWHYENNGDDKAENMTGLPVKRNHKASNNVLISLACFSEHDMISPRLLVHFRRNTNSIRRVPSKTICDLVLCRASCRLHSEWSFPINFNSKACLVELVWFTNEPFTRSHAALNTIQKKTKWQNIEFVNCLKNSILMKQ
jgi:hypothetical protein